MPKLLMWNLSRLKTPSKPLSGPLPDLYVRELTRLVEELQGVYLSGIQVGDARRFCISNPRFKEFPAVMYNPEILDAYDIVSSEGEGCLSFPGLWVSVPRFKWVEVRYRDGQWQEKTATFGSDNATSEEGLLAKAIQHEVFHMDGIVIHDRIKDPKKRNKVKAEILRQSIAQNMKKGVPELVIGPPEVDPSSLSVHAPVESSEKVPEMECGPEVNTDSQVASETRTESSS